MFYTYLLYWVGEFLERSSSTRLRPARETKNTVTLERQIYRASRSFYLCDSFSLSSLTPRRCPLIVNSRSATIATHPRHVIIVVKARVWHCPLLFFGGLGWTEYRTILSLSTTTGLSHRRTVLPGWRCLFHSDSNLTFCWLNDFERNITSSGRTRNTHKFSFIRYIYYETIQ